MWQAEGRYWLRGGQQSQQKGRALHATTSCTTELADAWHNFFWEGAALMGPPWEQGLVLLM